MHPGTPWTWTSSDRLGNEGMYLCGGRSYGNKFQGGGESIDSYPSFSLTHIFVQELPDNELAIVSATKEYTFEEDRIVETNSKAAVRGLILILPSLSSNAHLHPGTAWKSTSNRLGNEGAYFLWGPNCEDKFQGSGERIDSYPAVSLTHIWIQKPSENPREVVPTTAQYIMATGKQALVVLQSAASFIPIPLIREAVGVALKIIEVCEERCEVCNIPPRKGCKIFNIILLPEYIRRR